MVYTNARSNPPRSGCCGTSLHGPSEARRRDEILEQQRIQIEQQRIQIEQLGEQLDKWSGRITYYENPHSPPSANSIPARQRKRDLRKDPADYEKPGRKPGHRGASRTAAGRPRPYTIRPGRAGGAAATGWRRAASRI